MDIFTPRGIADEFHGRISPFVFGKGGKKTFVVSANRIHPQYYVKFKEE